MLATHRTPVELDVALGIQPLLAGGRDVAVGSPLDDTVDPQHVLLRQRPVRLDLKEVEHRASKQVRVCARLDRRPVGVAGRDRTPKQTSTSAAGKPPGTAKRPPSATPTCSQRYAANSSAKSFGHKHPRRPPTRNSHNPKRHRHQPPPETTKVELASIVLVGMGVFVLVSFFGAKRVSRKKDESNDG